MIALTCLGLAFALGVHWEFEPFTDGKIDVGPAVTISFLLVVAGFYLLHPAVKLLGSIWPLFGSESERPKQINYTQGWVQFAVVVPLMMAGYLIAAVLWGQASQEYATSYESFGYVFMHAWEYWPLPLSVAGASLWILSLCSIKNRKDVAGMGVAIFAPVVALLVLYALLGAIMVVLHQWTQLTDINEGKWRAFVWAPPMVLYAFSLVIVVLIGMMGSRSTEPVREWWSRLGAWMGIYGFAWMLIVVAAVYGPKWAGAALNSDTWKESIVGSWLLTTLAGLLAGKSSSTGGAEKSIKGAQTKTAQGLNLIATAAPFVFMAGLLLSISTCLHLVMLNLSGQTWSGTAILLKSHWLFMTDSSQVADSLLLSGALIVCLLLLGFRVDINEFSLNAFYRGRLSRCYLGATRFLSCERSPQQFTGFDDNDDLYMAALAGTSVKPPPGPLHIVNCALNLGGSGDLALHTRHSASFVMTPYVAGGCYKSSDPAARSGAMGYYPISTYCGIGNGPTLGRQYLYRAQPPARTWAITRLLSWRFCLRYSICGWAGGFQTRKELAATPGHLGSACAI